MPQSLSNVLIHVVFSTRHRTSWLRDREIRKELHRYMMGTLQGLECWPSALDGIEDHIHFLCQLSRKLPIMQVIEEVKVSSSKWIKTKRDSYRDFHAGRLWRIFSQ